MVAIAGNPPLKARSMDPDVPDGSELLLIVISLTAPANDGLAVSSEKDSRRMARFMAPRN